MTDWELVARNRLRLFWLGLILGVLAGACFGIVMTMPPVWIGDLPQAGVR